MNKTIDQLTYKSKNGGWTRSMDGISDPVAYYNKETGQNWDSDYPQLEDYGQTKDFMVLSDSVIKPSLK